MHNTLRFIKEPSKVYKLNGEELTKDDLHYLYIQGEKLSVLSIATIFECEPITIYLYLRKYHIGARKEDIFYYSIVHDMNQKLKKEHEDNVDREWRKRKKKIDDELRAKAIEIYGKPKPEPVIHMINGKQYVDNDLVEYYEKQIRLIMKQLQQTSVKQTKELNRIRNVDLSAMRLHRGLDMHKFSQASGIPFKTILYYEKTRYVIVPKEISNQYIKALNISSRELKKIKECLSGKRKTMFEEDSRDLTESVRQYVFKRDKGRCQKCGSNKYLHFHHIERYSMGGKHEARNLKLLCVKCHAMEHYGEKGFAMLKAQAEKLLGGEINWAN